jgi:diguanylate cyclase (GGDEF)-like protein
MDPERKPDHAKIGRTKPGAAIAAAQIGALLAAVIVVGLTHRTYRWDFWPIAIIVVFTVLSELTSIEAGAKVHVSGSGLGIMLAVVLLGGGPAAIVGAISILCGWVRPRYAAHYLLNNLAAFAWYPLLTGLFFHAMVGLAGVNSHSIGWYLLIFAAYVVMLTLNFAFVAGYGCYLDGTSLPQKTVSVFVPVLGAQLFSAVLTMAAVYLAIKLGTVALALLGVVFIIFQYLVSELLTSKRRSEELHRIATTDELTGLANREELRKAVEDRISSARIDAHEFAVMLMDLDRFKEINDTLGHHYGDMLLRELGPRLVEAVGSGGFVARLGGDEFAILPAETAEDSGVIEAVAGRLFACIQRPFQVDELSLEVGASIGIARFPQDGDDSHALLRCADIAMYSAKESQSDHKFYSADQDRHSVSRLSVLSDIRHALAADEIVVHFQPIVDLDNLRVTGAEGLVRWAHPTLGLIPPGAFVQTVEQTGLIGPLTRHVLERSIAQCAAWRRNGNPDMSVAVNLSVRNLLDRDLPKQIERLLSTYSLPPDALQLEITESMIMSDPDRALATVTRLSDLGVRMSVDDFGTGYSSLANLRKLPIDELKIDRSFVSPMLQDESDLIIVRSTINLGHDLGLRIIAEGVEDAETLDRLALLGCDLAQGFHVSRPMAADAFTEWLKESEPDLSSWARQGAVMLEPPANGKPSNGHVPARAAKSENDRPVSKRRAKALSVR